MNGGDVVKTDYSEWLNLSVWILYVILNCWHSFTVISLLSVQINSKSDRVGHLHWLQWIFPFIADCSERYASAVGIGFKASIVRVTLSLISVNALQPFPLPKHFYTLSLWPQKIALLITVNVNNFASEEQLLITVNVTTRDSWGRKKRSSPVLLITVNVGVQRQTFRFWLIRQWVHVIATG